MPLVLRVTTQSQETGTSQIVRQEVYGEPSAVWEDLGLILGDTDFLRCEVERVQ